MTSLAAMLFAALCLLPIGMHIGLIFGAPWGIYTMGGRWPGTLPGPIRLLLALQALLLVAIAVAVLNYAGLCDLVLPPYSFGIAFTLIALSALANNVTPSKPERRLWGPVTLALALLATFVWLA